MCFQLDYHKVDRPTLSFIRFWPSSQAKLLLWCCLDLFSQGTWKEVTSARMVYSFRQKQRNAIYHTYEFWQRSSTGVHLWRHELAAHQTIYQQLSSSGLRCASRTTRPGAWHWQYALLCIKRRTSWALLPCRTHNANSITLPDKCNSTVMVNINVRL